MSNYAVIVAGGKGKRMQTDENKCFLPLAGKEIVIWTIEAMMSSGVIDGIVCVVADSDEVVKLQGLLDRYDMAGSVQKIIPTSGPERQDGVWIGICALDSRPPIGVGGKLRTNDKTSRNDRDDIILIHNGANPLVKPDEIKACIQAAREYGASVAATRVKDTIKRVDDDMFAVETLYRKELWAMQTPQTIKYSIAIEAFERAFKDGFYGTDDVQLVERIGGRVKIVECSFDNFKITTPQDVDIAEQIVRRRQAV